LEDGALSCRNYSGGPCGPSLLQWEVSMYIKTHLCIDKDDLIGFLEGTVEVVSVKQIEYLGADGRTYTYEVRYK
jgi:hypothetical protein